MPASPPIPAPDGSGKPRTPLDRLVERGFGAGARLLPERAPDTCAYLLVQGAAGPRWLVPARPHPQALAAVATWRPHDRRAAIKWRAFVEAWRLGLAAALPGVERVWIAGDAGDGAPSIHLGTPDRRQKAILFHRTPAGGMAVRKLALSAGAEAAVTREIAILRQLATLRPGLAPAVLGADGVSVDMTWLDGTPVPARLDGVVLALLDSLRLDRQIEPQAGTNLPERLPAFIEHGDMAPWNLRRHPGGLHVLDWEDACIPGLPLQDLVGWLLAVGHVLRRRPVADVLAEGRPTLQAFAHRIGLDVGLAAGLATHGLVRRQRLALDRGDTAYAAALAPAIATPDTWSG